MNGWAVVVAGGVVVGYGALSRRLSTTVVSGPLVFMLCGLAIGPLGLDLLDPARDLEVTRALLEGALVLLLFADAAGIRAGDLRREEFLPLRLLAVGLPATMALGWLAAWPLLPGLTVWELALVAVVLAPTDAALGQQAVSNERVPALVRGGLSVESGLNDGLALPFFVLALAAAGEGHGHPGIAETFLRALLLSGAIGITAGWAGASLLRWSLSRGGPAPTGSSSWHSPCRSWRTRCASRPRAAASSAPGSRAWPSASTCGGHPPTEKPVPKAWSPRRARGSPNASACCSPRCPSSSSARSSWDRYSNT